MWAMPWKFRDLRLNEETLNPNDLRPGAQFKILDFVKDEQFTEPPQYLHEAELIALMDKHGIG